MNLNEDDIKFTYDLLGHEIETEVRLIDPTKKNSPISNFVKSKDEFVDVCIKNNGKYNIYAGINERKPGGTKGEDVLKVNAFVIDIDARRPDSKLPATDKELKHAEEAARVIFEFMESEGHNGYSALSGNGYQLWYPLPPLPARETLEKKIQTLQKEFKVRFETPEVDIDNIGDLPRIIKVIGTFNIKGPHSEERPHRLSRWLKKNGNIVKNDKLAKTIEDLKLPEKPKREWFDVSDEKIAEIIKDEKISQLLAGEWQEHYKSRSEAEMGLVCALATRGASKEQIFNLMGSCAIGKWQEKPESYHERTYENAVDFISKPVEIHKDDDPCPNIKTIFKHKKNEKGKITSTTIRTGVLGNYISHLFIFKTLTDTEEVFVYANGVYVPGETLIKSECQKIVGDKLIKTNHVKEAIDFIRRKTFEDRDSFDKDDKLINLKNGLYDVENKKIMPHTPDYLSFIQMPIEYNPNAKCPIWNNYLKNTLKLDEDRMILQEVAGWVFMGGYDIQKAVLLEGGGGNGKSVYLDTITAMLGADNVSSVSWQDLGDDKYAKAQLYGKLANIHTDLPKTAITDASAFKALTGGDKIWSDIKHSIKGINFYNRAKLIYAANQIPRTKDITDSFFDRIILVNFPYKIRGTKHEDKHLKKKLLNELPGIFNWAIVGLNRLLEKEEFSTSKTTEDFKSIFMKKSDSVFAFFKDMIRKGEKGIPKTKEDVYQKYVAYCRGNLSTEPLNKQVFGAAFGKQAGFIGSGQRKVAVDGEDEPVRVSCWTNIRIKDLPGKQSAIPYTPQGIASEKSGEKNSKNTIDTIPDRALQEDLRSNSPDNTKKEEKNKSKKDISDKNRKKGIVCIEEVPQKDRLLFLVRHIKMMEPKCINNKVPKSELIEAYKQCKWDDALEQDIITLMKDGQIYEPEHERYRSA
jgi:putative DNA primase/helicase